MSESQGQERIKREGRQLQKWSDHFANDKSSNCHDFSGHFDENQTLSWLFQMRKVTVVVYNVHVHVTIKITALLERYLSSWQGAVGSGSPDFFLSLCEVLSLFPHLGK